MLIVRYLRLVSRVGGGFGACDNLLQLWLGGSQFAFGMFGRIGFSFYLCRRLTTLLPPTMELRDAIRMRRKELGMTQKVMAELSGVNISTVKDIERGVANPSWSTVQKVLHVVGLEIDYKKRRK